MTKNYFNIAIHEAGHAVAFLTEGRAVDCIILDCDGLGGRVVPGKDGPKSIKSEAIIDLAGLMAEQVASEKGVLGVAPSPLPDFNCVPLEEKEDDESKYRSAVYRLQRQKPIWTRKGVDPELKRETRDLIERHWGSLLEIANAVYSAPEKQNPFSRAKEKVLGGAVVEKIFKQALVESP